MTGQSDGPKKRKGRKPNKGAGKTGKARARAPKAGARKTSDEMRRSLGEQRANRIKAIDHPLRRRILRILNEEDEPLSPNEVKRRLNMQLGAVSYQTRVLRKLGAVQLAASRQVRGALEHFHVSTIVDDGPILTLLDETRVFDEETAQETTPSA